MSATSPDRSDSRPAAEAPAVERVPRNGLIVLVAAAIVSFLGYSMLATGSAGLCVGGLASDGGYVDGSGNPTAQVPQCINVTMGPALWVSVLLAVITVAALIFWGRSASSPQVSARYLRRVMGAASTALLVIAFGASALAVGWLASGPVQDWDGTTVAISGPPLGVAQHTVEVSEMEIAGG